ncbi:response regulator transcription factor [Kitasatospora viridis]
MLQSQADVAVVLPGEQSAVAVVVVDQVARPVLDLVRTARNAAHRPEVVLVATDLGSAGTMHAITAGARGLLRRSEASADRLTRTVLAAAGGDYTVPPDLLDGLLEQRAATRAPAAEAPAAAGSLSDRERSVLRLVAEGRETAEIARELSYSPRTVTTVVHDITHRFQLRNRAHAVAYAMRAGLL